MTQQEIMNYRADFPLLRESKVAYLDNAATSQRPDCVLDAQRKFYETHNANHDAHFKSLQMSDEP